VIICDRENNVLADLHGGNEVNNTKEITFNPNERIAAIRIGTKETYRNAA